MNLPFTIRRELLESLLIAPKDPLRLSPLLQAPSGEVLEAVRNSAWKVLSGNESIPSTNRASDQVRGSSSARTWNRSS